LGIVRFGENLDLASCVLPAKTLEKTFCETTLALPPLQILQASRIGSAVDIVPKSRKDRDGLDVSGKPSFVDTTNCECRNAVLERHFTILLTESDGRTIVQSASVDLVVGNIVASKTSGCVVDVTQVTSVRFLTNNAAETRERSGNPGYISGYPLLVQECQEGGCTLPKPATVDGVATDGTCQLETSVPHQSQLLNFGEDATFSCYLSKTKAELKQLCDDASILARMPILNPAQCVVSDGAKCTVHVMHFGNNKKEWDWAFPGIEMQFNGPLSTKGKYDELNAVCNDIPVAVEYTILYARFGDVMNSQKKVVAAVAEQKLGSLSFTGPDPGQQDRLPIQASVTFIELPDNEMNTLQTPPRPPLPVNLPRDFFSPFFSTAPTRQLFIFFPFFLQFLTP
jgi:hypothetical protein